MIKPLFNGWNPGPSRPILARWRIGLVAAVVLSLAGLETRWIAEWGGDVPSPGEWATEAKALYQPWLHRTSALSGLTAAVAPFADSGARAWKLMWLGLNGQWNPQLLSLAAIGLCGLAGVFLFAVILRELAPLEGLALALGTLAFHALPSVSLLSVDPGRAWAGFLLLFSIVHLAGTLRCRPRSFSWWTGQFAGLANVLASAAGVASPLALLGWIAADRAFRRRENLPAQTGLAVWNAGLAAFGIARAALLAGRMGPPAVDATALLRFLAWPMSGGFWALIVCAPSIAIVCFTFRPGGDRPSTPIARVLPLWLLVQIAAFAFRGILPTGTWPAAFLILGLPVHLMAAILFPARGRQAALTKWFAAAAWFIVVLSGLVRQGCLAPDSWESNDIIRSREAAARRFVADRDIARLAATPEAIRMSAGDAAALIGDPRVMAILPPSVRPPISLVTSSAASSAFQPGAVPEIERKPEELPVWGSWKPDGSSRTGEFLSEPITAGTRLLQIYIAGNLHPPATSLVLRTAAGAEIGPLQSEAAASSHWTRLNFAVPDRPFRVVARVSRPDAWLAFTAPLEASRVSWFVGKWIAAWTWLSCAGFVLFSCAGLGAATAWRQGANGDAPAPRITGVAADCLPWLLLIAYAVFLFPFVDSIAGGADSSGYLNSARLLMGGRLNFPPREIPGIAAGVQLLAPLGFHANLKGLIAPGYPVGLPLMLAAAGKVVSLQYAIPLVIMGNLLLGVFFTKRLAETCGLSRNWSWVAATLVAFCPLYVFMGLQPMSDVPSLAWVTGALYFALASRERPSMALWAGMATAVAVLLRPANAICVLPAALGLGWSWRRLATWAIGGLPGALFAGWYDFHLYGNPFLTGYGDVSSAFSVHWAGTTLTSYAQWIPVYLTPAIWLALLGPWIGPFNPRSRIALAATAAAYLGFYAFYSYTHESWWFLRFVLPAFPALAILALGGLLGLLQRAGSNAAGRPGLLIGAAAVLPGLFAFNIFYQYSRLPILHANRGDNVYRDCALWIGEHASKEATVICFQGSGSMVYYTDLPIIRSEGFSEHAVGEIVRKLADLKRPVYALVVQYDAMPPIGHLPGRWESVACFDQARIWKLIAQEPARPGGHAPVTHDKSPTFFLKHSSLQNEGP